MPADFIRTFDQTGDFAAMHAAERFLSERGFSVGSNQRGAPRGVMFGNYDIAKWRNLGADERLELHGTLIGDGRNGPLALRIYASAPAGAIAALTQAEAA